MTRPTMTPRLRRDGPDRRVGQIDPWPAAHPRSIKVPERLVVLERDGTGWVRTDLSRPIFYRTLADARRAIASTNVARWVGAWRRAGGSDPDAAAFDAWVAARLPACPGVVRDGGWTAHDGCCDPTFLRRLPDGVDAAALYAEWVAAED